MNYMKMVSFVVVKSDYTISETAFYEREEFFRDSFPNKKIVPTFVIMESIFQTAGRMVRAYTNSEYGGIIASFSNFNFTRPILANETIRISSHLKSSNEKSCFVLISLTVENEPILQNGKLMLILEPAIISNQLNKFIFSDLLDQRKYFIGGKS